MSFTLFSYPHIEDYIEIISGYRKPDGTKLSMWEPHDPLLSLARYDVNMIESLATQTLNGTGYTDRQAPLAREIVYKYSRQLAKHHISIDTVKEKPEYRLPVRALDRSSRSWIENETIYIRFPFNTDLINLIKLQAKESSGSVKFNYDRKLWEAQLTEPNVNWVYAFSQSNNFEIDPSLKSIMDLILACEQTPYAIELQAGTELSISNATDTLNSYIQEHLGGFSLENLLHLVDYSPILGYTVEPVITDTVIEAFGTRFWALCSNRELKVDTTTDTPEAIKSLIAYATETNRFPIYVYEPDLSDRLTMLFVRHFKKGEVVNLDTSGVDAITSETKLVHVRKIPKEPVNAIPLMVSSAGMVFGGDRQLWLQQAEKIVYFTKDVYNKKTNQGREICKLD